MRYAGTMTKKRAPAMGRTGRRYGSRQTKEQTARREMVCEGFRQVRRRSRRFWKTNTTPILDIIQSAKSHSRAGDLPGIKAPEVVGHQREGEARPVDILGGSHIWAHIKLINLLLRYDLL